ncbi:quinone oxidoreductase family protein [Noviherbaspirillum saxi]|uniref:Zinc-binding alcohol dehydrogenase family protein n=1 Tax=Noviherbaspirillum saxi TaxID=2320863 RepID=A0A3A3G3R8_9BURK|nr:zinc-binding alcohol dehydrogenase family protein [Noviherbaspirillum saxi]RJF92713.1 zinc-binding alcohol dehydrogenase family protein [Noviherbaspirillum saxi]
MKSSARALRLIDKADSPDTLRPQLVEILQPQAPAGSAVIEVLAAAINPSDVKAALGMMPYAVWPRTPGRDYAGKVVAGPAEWLGANVWGTGGDLGITRDGTHARYLILPVEALVHRPAHISLAAAATVGVPFVTAFEGLRRADLKGKGQTVLVLGSNGKVGQAAVQLATRAGARVIGVERGGARYVGHASSPIEVFDGTRSDLASAVLAATDGQGVDIAYNTVGSPYFQAALDALRIGGVQILISTPDRNVPFDIMAFYRRDLRLLGVDSLKLNATQCADVFRVLLPGFENGSLRAFDVSDSSLLPLDNAVEAYRQVLEGSKERLVLEP